jgi:hypothetical protein
MSEDKIVTATVTQFIKMTGLGKTKTYELINSGALETAKLGTLRLVLMDSYYRLLDRHRVVPKRHPEQAVSETDPPP